MPYFWAGLKAYDLVAGSKNLVLSKFVSPAESIQRYPSLAQTSTDGHSLKGTVRAGRPRALEVLCVLRHPSHLIS